MPTTLPLDDTDLAALIAVLAGGQPSIASVAVEIGLAEALTVQAESCPVCSSTEGGLCAPCRLITSRAVSHRLRADRLRAGAQ
jgi:hypothetical protein